jgi:hypothetical protein
VSVTAKSNSGADWSDPINILDPEWQNGFQSADEPNQWICCDFHDRRVALDYVKMICDESLPVSMEVEGSIDGETWTRLHSTLGLRDRVDDHDAVFYQILGSSRE